MRKAVSVLMLAALLVLAGCAPTGGQTTVPMGQPVTLAPGENVQISGENLKLTFVNVVTDSRCPTGAT